MYAKFCVWGAQGGIQPPWKASPIKYNNVLDGGFRRSTHTLRPPPPCTHTRTRGSEVNTETIPPWKPAAPQTMHMREEIAFSSLPQQQEQRCHLPVETENQPSPCWCPLRRRPRSTGRTVRYGPQPGPSQPHTPHSPGVGISYSCWGWFHTTRVCARSTAWRREGKNVECEYIWESIDFIANSLGKCSNRGTHLQRGNHASHHRWWGNLWSSNRVNQSEGRDTETTSLKPDPGGSKISPGLNRPPQTLGNTRVHCVCCHLFEGIWCRKYRGASLNQSPIPQKKKQNVKETEIESIVNNTLHHIPFPNLKLGSKTQRTRFIAAGGGIHAAFIFFSSLTSFGMLAGYVRTYSTCSQLSLLYPLITWLHIFRSRSRPRSCRLPLCKPVVNSLGDCFICYLFEKEFQETWSMKYFFKKNLQSCCKLLQLEIPNMIPIYDGFDTSFKNR